MFQMAFIILLQPSIII